MRELALIVMVIGGWIGGCGLLAFLWFVDILDRAIRGAKITALEWALYEVNNYPPEEAGTDIKSTIDELKKGKLLRQ
jgi:hypothetical protein